MRLWLWFLLALVALPASATTWYVRPDGGTRYSTGVKGGQCDGMADAAYPGHGTNQHCAFNDVRLLWQDGTYATNDAKFPSRGWIGQGGDTYLIHGSIAAGTQPYRVGWSSLDGNGADPALTKAGNEAPYRGWRGDPYSGPPSPPAGTAAQHTRILGENWQNCHAQNARTPVVAGWLVGSAFNFSSSYVDFQCFDISDKSDCVENCSKQDAGKNGIGIANTADHLLLQDVRIHGMQQFGIIGPSGDASVFRYLSLVGNGGGGWSADSNDGKTGTGTLLVQHFEILWNGCGEEYPIVDKLPYTNCRDQNSGGYGDGFGTATVVSKPGWQAHFDQGEVAYNTQDGLDALHLIGSGSSMTVTRVLAYGNMGQQIKVGGAQGKAANNLIVGNCRAMAQRMPGTPQDYNHKLSDFCRAGDVAVLLTVGRNANLLFENNTVYAAGTIGVDLECDTSTGECDGTSRVTLQNNVFLEFANGPANGNKDGDGRNATAIYNNTQIHPFTNRGSMVRNNTIFHQRTGYPCPMGKFDLAAVCGSPQLKDQTFHLYGYGDMHPVAGGSSAGSGATVPGLAVDFSGAERPAKPARGALEPGSPAVPETLKQGVSGSTKGDEAGGGGGALAQPSASESSEVFSPADELPVEEGPGQAASRVGHRLLKPALVCVAAVGGAGLFLLGRVSKGRAV